MLSAGDLHARPRDPARRRGEAEIALSAKEFALLETFMRRPGEVLDRHQLLEHAWDYEYENRSNVVDVYVRYLREKIDRPFGVRVDRDRARRRLPPARRRRSALVPVRLVALVGCALLAGAAVAVALTRRGGDGLIGASRAGAIVWAVGDGANGSDESRRVAG